MEFPINTGSIYKKKKCILIDWLAVFLVLALQGKQQLWLSRLPHSLGGDTANGEVPLCLSVAVHLKALLSLWKWKLLMYVTDNGPGGEIGNGSSLMARTEGMNRAGIIERPWVACQVILRGWLDECVAARRRRRRGGGASRIQNRGMREERSKRDNCLALTSEPFLCSVSAKMQKCTGNNPFRCLRSCRCLFCRHDTRMCLLCCAARVLRFKRIAALPNSQWRVPLGLAPCQPHTSCMIYGLCFHDLCRGRHSNCFFLKPPFRLSSVCMHIHERVLVAATPP